MTLDCLRCSSSLRRCRQLHLCVTLERQHHENPLYRCFLVAADDAPDICCKPLRLFLVAAAWILLLLAPILILLKLESVISGSWGAVLIPLWILFPLVPCCGPMIGLFPTAEDNEGEPWRPDSAAISHLSLSHVQRTARLLLVVSMERQRLATLRFST